MKYEINRNKQNLEKNLSIDCFEPNEEIIKKYFDYEKNIFYPVDSYRVCDYSYSKNKIKNGYNGNSFLQITTSSDSFDKKLRDEQKNKYSISVVKEFYYNNNRVVIGKYCYWSECTYSLIYDNKYRVIKIYTNYQDFSDPDRLIEFFENLIE